MKRFIVYALLGLCLTANLSWAMNSTGGDYQEGQRLYKGKCQLCHGSKGNGEGPAASSMSIPPANFTEKNFWEENTDEEISSVIKDGKGEMPAFNLTPSEIKSIIGYMHSTFEH